MPASCQVMPNEYDHQLALDTKGFKAHRRAQDPMTEDKAVITMHVDVEEAF